ncbi:MAG: SPOR domain-containing protein [Pseudolabrys sp.]|nr:SPOR domain-containing protein [Pseudolabrys sp.]
MADDQNQRPYRGSEASQRSSSGGSAPASDPLAELARLIGQNDPFSEFGRDGTKRVTAAPRQPEPAASWQAEPTRIAPAASPDFSRQSFGSAPLAGGSDNYYTDNQQASQGVPDYDVPGYGAPGYEATGFPAPPAGQGYEDAYPPAAAQHGPGDDDYYDDAPPNRRRLGVLAIAGLFALAVIGTAGAFGYRAVFGTSTTSGPPPVIKAEQAPSKIVPAAVANKDAPKIAERANERPGEKLVSREEQPVVVTTTMPPAANPAQPQGSGVVGSEPKRIRTIAIKPDQPGDANMPPPVDSIPAPTAQPRVIATTPQRPPAPQAQAPQSQPSPVESAPAARAEAPANAPLSLNPGAQAPARNAAPAAPQRAAAISPPPPTSTGSTGVYGVQVTAQRSEEEAQTAFRSLQGKFPGQLGNRQPLIKRVDAGEKGIFYGAQVGPFTDAAQAKQMCESFKAAGGTCLVKKN